MPTPSELLWLVVLPAALALAGRFAGFATRRRPDGAPDPASAAPSAFLPTLGALVGFGLGAAFGPPGVRPSLPLAPADPNFWWVLWLAPAGALVGFVERPLPAPLRVALRAAAGAAAAWLVLPPSHRDLGSAAGLLRIGTGAALAAVVGSALAEPRAPHRRAAAAAGAVVALAGAGLAFTFVGKSVVMGQTAIALSAAVGALAAPVPPRMSVGLPRPVAGVVALATVTLAAAGHAFLNIESPWHTQLQWPVLTALLVAVAPAAGAVVPARVPAWLGLVLAAAVAAALVAGAAVAGGILDAPPDPHVYGW